MSNVGLYYAMPNVAVRLRSVQPQRTFGALINARYDDYCDLQKSVNGHRFVRWPHWQLGCSIHITHGCNSVLSWCRRSNCHWCVNHKLNLSN